MKYTHKGREVNISFETDTDSGMPWDYSEGHGPVRKSNNSHRSQCSDKKPGERPLNSPDHHEYQYYYDWKKACKLARTDGWNCEPYDAPNRIQRAVKSDFDYLRAYLAQDWEYVVVTVECDGETDSVGSVETYKNYHLETAQEMARELVDRIRDARAAELRKVRADSWGVVAC